MIFCGSTGRCFLSGSSPRRLTQGNITDMKKYTVLFNPNSSSRRGRKSAERLAASLGKEAAEFVDITSIENFPAFFEGLQGDRTLIVCGGDGTLNRLINTEGFDPCGNAGRLMCFPSGSGNDFYKDVRHSSPRPPVPLGDYFLVLPTAELDGGRRFRFLNGLGSGLDGYCCDEGNRMRAATGKRINYTGIALKGLLGKYSPRDVTVTVDGDRKTYAHTWLAAVMNGRYFGGGMKPAPDQDRLGDSLTVMIFSGRSRFLTTLAFPLIFLGLHKHLKGCVMLTGSEITVEYSSPAALQIDGETVEGVTSFRCVKPARKRDSDA